MRTGWGVLSWGSGTRAKIWAENQQNVSSQRDAGAKRAHAILGHVHGGFPSGSREVISPVSGPGMTAAGILCPILVPTIQDAHQLEGLREELRE